MLDIDLILQIYKSGKTQREIGKMFDVKPQYISQFLNRFVKKDTLNKIRQENLGKRIKNHIVKFTCPECGITKETIYIKRKFCSRKCMTNYQRKHLSQYNNKLRRIII